MKKIITLALILTSFVITHTTQIIAQKPKEIRFSKGKVSAVIKGNTGEYGITYFVNAKAGQKLVLTLTPTNKVGIKVETLNNHGQIVLLREEQGGTYQIGLETNGVYTIFVGSTISVPVPFTLTVKIGKLADI